MGEGAASNLPPGFRFFPTDEELVGHFLYRKAARLPCSPDIIPSLDSRRLADPWHLNAGVALAGGNGWYFFTRNFWNRSTPSGYWRSLDADETVTGDDGAAAVGVKKSFAFHIGGDEPPEGTRTSWFMHEYHLLSSSKKRGHQPKAILESAWVLCRVFEASGSDDGTDMSGLDEAFLSLDDDLDEVSCLPD